MSLYDIMQSNDPGQNILEWLEQTGFERYPVLDALKGVDQGEADYHRQDVLPHMLQTAQNMRLMDKSPASILGAFCHDIGKPETRIVKPDGKISFPDHAEKGAELLPNLLTSLVADQELPESFFPSNPDGITVINSALLHMHVQLLADDKNASDKAIYRLYNRLGVNLDHLFNICRADRMSQYQQTTVSLDNLVARMVVVTEKYKEKQNDKKALLSGEELVELLGPGKEVGIAKKALIHAEEMATIVTKEEAILFILSGKYKNECPC